MRVRRWLATLAALVAPVAAFGGATPQVILAQPGSGDGNVERFTLRFNTAMVPLGDPRATAPFKTECAGQGRWVDQQTWVFDFAAPIAGDQKCTFAAAEGVKSVGGYALAGQTRFEVDAGGPVARAVLPGDDDGEIEEGQVFLVATTIPAARASIASNAYCAVDGVGEKIPVDVLAPDLPARLLTAMSANDYSAFGFLDKALVPFALLKPAAAMRFRATAKLPAGEDAAARAKALANVVALKCHRPLPPGRDVALVWSGAITSALGKPAGADQRYDFTVRKPFAARFECTRVNAASGCNPVQPAYVRFSAPIAMAKAAAVRIRLPDGKEIAPTFSDSEKKQATIADVTFARPLPFETAGEVVLPGGITDESGRALTNGERFPLGVRFDRAPPLVKFAGAFGILEAKQGGVLPVTVRNVEAALQGRSLPIGGRTLRVDGSDGAVAQWLRTVDDADDDRADEIRDKDGEVVRRVNRTGDASILPGGQGSALSVALPGKGRDFEVVGIPLAKPGFYVVELASPMLGRALLGRDAPRYVATAALVTNLAVHFKWGRERSLAWVTSLDTGKPVAGAAVTISDSCTGERLMHGVTGRNGAVLSAPGLPEPSTYGSCEQSEHPLMVSARAGDDFSFTLTTWGEGIRPYDFELPYGYSAPGEVLHTIFDRALLKQGDTIHMKHLLRRPVGAGFAIPAGFTGTLRLSHRGSETQFDVPLTIDANGVGETSWTAPAGAPMGDYDLTVIAGDGREVQSGQSFKLDEYRLPTMRASVSGPKAAAVRPRSLPLDLYVGYLSGGGAANLPVDVRIGWFAHGATPEGYESYTFGGKAVAEGVTALDGDGDDAATALPPTQTLPVTLGGDGAARTAVDVPAVEGVADMRVEMDYQDANGEVLTASRSIPIFPSAVQLGAKTDGWLQKQDDLRLRFVALDLDGKPIKGRKVSVALYRREILTARRRLIGGFYAYDNQVRTTKLDAACTATTDAQGLANCAVDPGVSGEVYAVATTTDADGNVARAVTSAWLAGDDDWWFGGDNGDRMDVVPEKLAYRAGEVARFQVRMPFRAATALVTVEREGVLSSFVTELSGTDPVIAVPMPGSYAPDVFVSVLAVRGRIEPGWSGWFRRIAETLGLVSKAEPAPEPTAMVDLAKPAYRLGIAKVKVGWEAHQLNVAVKAERDRFAPRATANVMVQVRRPDGSAARTADVAFAAVDEALLQLAPNDSWDVLTALMGERPLAVLTSTAQTQVVGKRHYGRKAVEAGGGGGGDQAALNRENFQPVLLWRGRVALDAQGRAQVAVPLSDALSSFKLVAIATDGSQLYGTGSARIRTAQDLSLYPGLPPLVREGDFFAAGFTLRNGSAKPMTVTASVDLFPRIAQGRPITVTIPAGGAAPIAWNLTAPQGIANLRWQVKARSADGRAVDQVTVTQDVFPAVPVEVWAQTLARVADTSIPVGPPAGALPGRGAVDVRLADTLAPPMAGVRDYMARYPFDCFEQRLSRMVVFDDLAGWRALAGEIPVYQAENGLLRYFPSPMIRGSEALTSYVLSVTAAAGWPLPEEPRRRMVVALAAVVDGRLRSEDYGDVRLQKLAAFTALARAGAATPAMIGQVGMAPAEMPTANLADYIVAVDRVPGLGNAAALKAQAENVLRSRMVYEGARLDLSDAANTAWWLMQSADEAAIKATAIAVGRPGWQDEAPKMMVGAASRQARGHWDTTVANAWGALLVRQFAAAYPAQAIAGTTTLALGPRTIAKVWPLAADQRLASFALPAGPLPLMLRQAGGAGPWATVSVSAAVPLRAPLFAGYRLSRTVAVVQARNAGRLTRGDVLRVTLTVEASAERSWVAITDPVPAGATIVGSLANQSQLLAQGGPDDASQPSYVERGKDAWRAFFAWLPRGTTTVSYTVRLNGAGRFSLPPSEVEAMYSPAIRAALPNAPVSVGAR